MTVLEKLKEAVRSVVADQKTNLYQEARLADGRMIATEADEWVPGVMVSVMSEEGEAGPLEPGTYPLADEGSSVVIGEGSVLAELITAEAVEVVEAADETEEKPKETLMKYDDILAGLVARFNVEEGLAKTIADFVAEVYGEETEMETVPEAEEEGYRDGMADEKEDEREDMSAVTKEMITALGAISERLEKLEAMPASNPDRVSPQGTKKNLSAQTAQQANQPLNAIDRALQIISEYK